MSEILLERRFIAQLADVWALWTEPAEIERWWGPNGFSVRVEALDLRVGGQMRYAMIAQDPAMVAFMKAQGMPTETITTLTFFDIVPMQRLAWRALVDFVPGHAPYETAHVVEIGQMGAQVHLKVSIERMHDDLWTNRSRLGWEQELDRLVALVAAV